MIDFEIGDELELVRATAREFADDHLRPALRQHESTRALSDATRAAFRDIGFATLEWPESLGGSGLGSLARFIVLEELAAADPGATLALDPLGPALYALVECGGEAALERFGAPLADGEADRSVLVWCGEGCRAKLEFGDDAVSGAIPWLPADAAAQLVLLDAHGAHVVSEGFTLEPARGAGLRAAGASSVTLDRAPIAASYPGGEAAARAAARGRLYTVAMLIGIARESAEYSRAYALDRVAFGKPIAHHQALAFLIADMATATDSARLAGWDAAWRLDSGHGAEEACATAFIEAAEQAMYVTPNGVQILGGHGFMQDHPVEKMMREARALSLLFGGVDAARNTAISELIESDGPVQLTWEAPDAGRAG